MNSPSTILRGVSFMAQTPLYGMYNNNMGCVQQMFYTRRRSGHPFQFVDHARYARKPAVPELRVPGVQPERLEQFGIMLGAAGSEYRQIALGKAGLGVFVDCVERVHQAIAERIGVNVERRMDEVRDVHPEVLVARADIDGRAEALALHAEPDFADALRGQFAVAPLG